MRRVPASLAALMAASFVLALAWAALIPLFQAPDEQTHFAYTQYLAETGKLPGDITRSIYSTEHGSAAFSARSDFMAAIPQVKPEWSDAAYEQWAVNAPTLARDDGGGATSASSYPPLSYLWQAAGYVLAGGDFFDRLFATRLASALWLPVTVLATWLLAGELFGRRRLLQLAAAAVPALLPMVAFVSGSVNPDGMVYALWTLALWLGARCLRQGLTAPNAAALAAVAGLACVTKATSYALLPGVALVLLVGLWRRRPLHGLTALRAVAPAALALLVTLGAWFLLAGELDRAPAAQVADSAAIGSAGEARGLATYLWNFYSPIGGDAGYPVFQTWVKQAWASFGWLEVKFPDNLYRALGAATFVVGVAAIVAVVRARRRVDWAVVAFLAVVAASLLAGLHWTDFSKGGTAFLQGRYLLPLVGLFGVVLAAAVTVLPARARPPAVGAALAVLLVVHLLSLGLFAERFYA